MGYVVKTPSGCFAIDISHRWAKELAPYIDFSSFYQYLMVGRHWDFMCL
jgi:hypothetical protein